MQKKRDFTRRLVACLIVFMLTFTNFATLGSALVYAASSENADAVNFAAQFVMIENSEENTEEPEQTEPVEPVEQELEIEQEPESTQESEEPVVEGQTEEQPEQQDENEGEENQASQIGSISHSLKEYEENQNTENQVDPESENSSLENQVNEDDFEAEETEENEPEIVEPETSDESVVVEPEEPVVQEQPNEPEKQVLRNGLAIEITVGVKDSGYLKNARVDIKDLANQMFTLEENISLGEYIQSIEDNKIKLKQINNGTEVKVYIPVKLKDEEYVNIKKLQEGVELILTTTYVDKEGAEEILTKTVKPVLEIQNNLNLIVGSEIEKFIPYTKDGVNEALVQIRVTIGTDSENDLPVKDTSTMVTIPKIEGAEIKDVTVDAISTGFTNGLTNGEAIFTTENWNYQDAVVNIRVDNVERDSLYKKNSGNDEYIISYKYSNLGDTSNMIVNSTVEVITNVFTSAGTNEISNQINKEYNLSEANQNIITYDLTRKTGSVSKGYLYGNANSENPEYELEYDNTVDINISRVELVNTIEVRETDEYFIDMSGNRFTAEGNTYYKSVKVNREKLLSIIGENGNLELLLEDGTSLITVDKFTESESDGNITISFGENKIGKILIRINNPEAEGILDIVTIKAIQKSTYEKMDIMQFEGMQSDYIAAAELIEGIVTEMGTKSVYTELTSTITNPSIILSRKDLSTLVENKDIEIELSLNNGLDTSDMYKNPVFELTFPKEVTAVNIQDVNLLYGNDELEIGSIETFENENGNVILRIILNGIQTKYALGESDKGTTVILKTDITVDMYTASRKSEIEMNYYNEDATNYGIGSDWKMVTDPSSYMLLGRHGEDRAELNIIAPEGLVNAQMITGYKDEGSIISVNQGRKQDTVGTFKDARQAEMKMIVINNTDEDMKNVSILGRTIFNGNKAITEDVVLGTNITAPMITRIATENAEVPVRIYYSEKEDATRDLNNSENGWSEDVTDIGIIKSYLIVLEDDLKVGSMMTYKYGFNIPEKLVNNIDMAGTFATYYEDSEAAKVREADRVVLTTGDAPVLNVETVSDVTGNAIVEGQRIKYTVRVKNEGRSTSENTIVNSLIPEGTTYVNENGETDPNVTELKIELGQIAPGSTEEVTYEVEVNKSTSVVEEIQPDNNVEAEGLEEPIYTTIEEPMIIQAAKANIRLSSTKSNYTIQQGREIEYVVIAKNLQGTALENCIITQVIPEGMDYVESYIEEFKEDGITAYKGESGEYDSSTRTVTWHVDKIESFKGFKLLVKTGNIDELERRLSATAKLTADNLDTEYVSNEVNMTLAKPKLEVSYFSNVQNKYLNNGDTVEYVLDLKNIGKAEAKDLQVQNLLPEGLTVVSAKCIKDNGTQINGLAIDNVNIKLNLLQGHSAKVVLKCIAENVDTTNAEKITANNWVISGENVPVQKTSAIQNIIQPTRSVISSDSNNNDFVIDNGNNNNDVQSEVKINEENVNVTNESKYRIIGRAFNDMNKNGQRDDNEDGMENIVAKLCDVASQEIVAQTVTNAGGEYVFDNVPVGDYYVKFEYDSSKYQVTDYKKEGVNSDRNSDAIVSNYKAVTDKISITNSSVSDIDIGLYRAGIFDFSLDANINRLTVQNEKGTTTYEMENSKLAKVDIDPKETSTSKIFVEYTIDVSNKGEIAGYAKSIMSYLPEELELDTSLNANWYVDSDRIAHTRELENEIIQPGETKTITLLLTKQMTDDGTGLINNIFEIENTFNEYAISDIDSVEGNHADGEDDMSSADVIIGIKTGGGMISVMIITATLITLIAVLYVIKLHTDNKNREVII